MSILSASEDAVELENKIINLLTGCGAPQQGPLTADSGTQAVGLQNDRRSKLARSSVRSFARGARLVTSGIRLAYLVDTLDLDYHILPALQGLFNTENDAVHERILLVYEIVTGQTFVVNARLAADLDCNAGALQERHTFIATDRLAEQSLDQDILGFVSAGLLSIKHSATSINRVVSTGVLSEPCLLESSVLSKIFSTACSSETDSHIRTSMITLCGILLEYPFVYFTPTLESRGTVVPPSRVDLTVAELLLSHEGEELQVVKFSLPQSHKAAKEAHFDETLRHAHERYEDRMTRLLRYYRSSSRVSMTTCSFTWRVLEHVAQSRLVL